MAASRRSAKPRAGARAKSRATPRTASRLKRKANGAAPVSSPKPAAFAPEAFAAESFAPDALAGAPVAAPELSDVRDGEAAAPLEEIGLRALASRLQAVLKAQIERIERICAQFSDDPELLPLVQSAIQSSAHATRTLRELAVVKQLDQPQADADDAEFYRDEDALRSEILRRLEAIAAEQQAQVLDVPEPGAAGTAGT